MNMKLGLSGFGGICLVTLLGLVFACQGGAQDSKKGKPLKMYTVQGSVQNLDKTKMSITVRTSSVAKDVVYSTDTKFLYGHSKDNKPGMADQLKEEYYISCAGTYDGATLKAKECVYRERK